MPLVSTLPTLLWMLSVQWTFQMKWGREWKVIDIKIRSLCLLWVLDHECFGSNNTIHIESFDSGSYCLYICVQYLLNVILKHILLHCCHSCDNSVNICPEDGVVDRSCFNEAQDFIFETMRNRCACMYKNTENSICRVQWSQLDST